jgi:hypothetical protein
VLEPVGKRSPGLGAVREHTAGHAAILLLGAAGWALQSVPDRWSGRSGPVRAPIDCSSAVVAKRP